MNAGIEGFSPEAEHLGNLLSKCKRESNPHRLLDHLQAVKTLLVAHAVQQGTLLHQIQKGEIVEGELEDKIISECATCAGDTRKVVQQLHKFMRKYEDKKRLDSMEFRVSSTKLLANFEKSLNNFQELFSRMSGHA